MHASDNKKSQFLFEVRLLPTFSSLSASANEARGVEREVRSKSRRTEKILASSLINKWNINFLLNGLISAVVGEIVSPPTCSLSILRET